MPTFCSSKCFAVALIVMSLIQLSVSKLGRLILEPTIHHQPNTLIGPQ